MNQPIIGSFYKFLIFHYSFDFSIIAVVQDFGYLLFVFVGLYRLCFKHTRIISTPLNDQNSFQLKNKLFEKNQNKYQVQHSVDAISIYYRHINKLPDLNLNQNDKKFHYSNKIQKALKS